MKRLAATLALVIGMTVGVAAPASAHAWAPCTSSNPHGTITYVSGGVTHARILYKHVWTTDTYNVYHWSGYYWVYQGREQCYYGPFH